MFLKFHCNIVTLVLQVDFSPHVDNKDISVAQLDSQHLAVCIEHLDPADYIRGLHIANQFLGLFVLILPATNLSEVALSISIEEKKMAI